MNATVCHSRPEHTGMTTLVPPSNALQQSLFSLISVGFVYDFFYHTGYYLTKVASNPGAGDVLMGFLGSVILSFAFSMFKQRKVTIYSS